MEWLIIPGMVGVLFAALLAVAIMVPRDDIGFPPVWAVLLAALPGAGFLVSLIGCPISYYASKTETIQAQTYYEQFVQPNALEEGDDYVVISNPEAGWWQAGDMNLSSYNAWLRSTRYWDSVPILGSCVYRPPDELKYVRIHK